jgi:hypothetical protein
MPEGGGAGARLAADGSSSDIPETVMTQQRNDPQDTRGEAPTAPADQQELYGRRAPRDLDVHGGVGRDPDQEDEPSAAEPGRGQDATGRPSTARSGANTQT